MILQNNFILLKLLGYFVLALREVLSCKCTLEESLVVGGEGGEWYAEYGLNFHFVLLKCNTIGIELCFC